MIQYMKNLWIKWKYRKYFRSMKSQSEYYAQLARSLQMAYNEFNKPENINTENMYVDIPEELLEMDIPALKNEVAFPDLMHSQVKIKELYINGEKENEIEISEK